MNNVVIGTALALIGGCIMVVGVIMVEKGMYRLLDNLSKEVDDERKDS